MTTENNKELQEAIQEAERVARHGDPEEKAGFVRYCNDFITYNKEQYKNTGDEKNRENVIFGKEIYLAYLVALN